MAVAAVIAFVGLRRGVQEDVGQVAEEHAEAEAGAI
jgi:hypothetical protein